MLSAEDKLKVIEFMIGLSPKSILETYGEFKGSRREIEEFLVEARKVLRHRFMTDEAPSREAINWTFLAQTAAHAVGGDEEIFVYRAGEERYQDAIIASLGGELPQLCDVNAVIYALDQEL